MGQVLISMSLGVAVGSVLGFYIGYAWAESNLGDKVREAVMDIRTDTIEFKGEIKKEIRELLDSIKD